MNLLLNVLWVFFGGLWMAVGWLLAAVIMAITIIGIPWARAAFNMARYAFLPFGFAAVDRDVHLGEGDLGTGPLAGVGDRHRNLDRILEGGWGLCRCQTWLPLEACVGQPMAEGHCGFDVADRSGQGVHR